MRHFIPFILLFVLAWAPANAAVLHLQDGQAIEIESYAIDGDTLRYVMKAGTARFKGMTKLERVVRVVEDDGTERVFNEEAAKAYAVEEKRRNEPYYVLCKGEIACRDKEAFKAINDMMRPESPLPEFLKEGRCFKASDNDLRLVDPQDDGGYIWFSLDDKPGKWVADTRDTKLRDPMAEAKNIAIAKKQRAIAFELTPRDFVERFNAAAQDYGDCGMRLRIVKKVTSTSGGYVYTVESGKYQGLVLSSDASDGLTGALLISQGDGTLRSGVCVLASVVCFLDATDPSFNPSSRRLALKKLGLISKPRKTEGKYWRNGVSYSYSFSDQIGLTLAAEPE